MKKKLLLGLCVIMLSYSSTQAAGGLEPCLATCLLGGPLGDSRIGLYMNDGKPIESTDWLIFGANIAGSLISSFLPPVYEKEIETGDTTATMKYSMPLPLGSIIAGFDAYNKSKTAKGFCAGFLWGRRAGSEINTTKIRTKEIFMCIPILNLYPCIALPYEAYTGKTMSEVIEKEKLQR